MSAQAEVLDSMQQTNEALLKRLRTYNSFMVGVANDLAVALDKNPGRHEAQDQLYATYNSIRNALLDEMTGKGELMPPKSEAAWIPVKDWVKVNHKNVTALYLVHKAWAGREVYWDAIGGFWRNDSGEKCTKDLQYILFMPAIPPLPLVPEGTDQPQQEGGPAK